MTERSQQFRIAVRQFGPFENAIEAAWQRFVNDEKLDLTLDAQALDLHPLEKSLFTEQGLKDGTWDIAFMPTDWVALAFETQAIVDLAPMIAVNPPVDYPQGWTESLLRMQQFGNAVIGTPYHDGPEVLIYRADLFSDPAEQAAFEQVHDRPLSLPQTWDEFREVACFFHRPDQGLYGTVFAAYPDGHNTVYDFCLQLWSRGGELFDQRGALTVDTPQARQALAFYRAILNDTAAVHPQAREMDSVKSGFAFANGEVAMMVNWFGFAAMCETIDESKVKGKVMIGAIPHDSNVAPVSLNVYWILAVAAGSPHQDIAYRFLRFCASAEIDKLLTLEGGIGCRKSTWSDAEVNATIPFYRELESLHDGARELPRLSNWAELATIIDEMMLAAINTDRAVADILRDAQQKADQMIGH